MQARQAESGLPTARTASGDVFISYASQDKPVADSVCKALEGAGMACWIAPRNVTPGELYAESIVHAIDSTRAVVLVLSQNAAASPHVLREVERGSSKRHPVVSFRIDRAPLPAGLEYFLNTSQWLDAGSMGIDRALPRLVDAVKTALAQIPAAARVTPVPGATTEPIRRPGRMAIALAIILAGCLTYFTAEKFWQSQRVPSEAMHGASDISGITAVAAVPEKSVAVLPFLDLSEHHDQEYFSDGLSEELIDKLARVPDLRVSARTSSFYYKGKQATIAEMARALGVKHVLEGSVRKSGNTLRIAAQLVRVDTGYQIWSKTYDRKLEDIFRIQEEIATAVVEGLKASLLGTASRQETPTINKDAYMLYLRAQEVYYHGNSSESSRQATDFLQQAVELDPDFTLAWAALARNLAGDYNLYNPRPRAEAREQIYAAVNHARKLDPNLPLIHVVMGRVLYEVDWNWQAASVEIKQAIALEPGNPEARRLAGYLAITFGRFDEAIGHLGKALELDPLQPWNYIVKGYADYRFGRLADAEADFRDALEIAPASGKFHLLLGSVFIARGQAQLALAEMKQEADPRFRRVGMALAQDAIGDRGEADKELAVAEQNFGDDMSYWIALIYAGRRDPDRAFAWLDRALRTYADGVLWIKGDPLLRDLVADPRYRALLRKMNLPE